MDRLGLSYWQKAFSNLASAFENEKLRLCQLDGAIGDGDHGTSMALGFSKASESLAGQAPRDVADLFKATGNAFISSVGGVTGIVFGTMFLAAGKEVQGQPEIGTEGLAGMFAGALEATKNRGKVQEGSKSMVDALSPAVTALREAADKGLDVEEALARASESAHGGMEATRQMEARVGRARYQKGKGKGHIDAGAASVALVFKTLAKTVVE